MKMLIFKKHLNLKIFSSLCISFGFGAIACSNSVNQITNNKNDFRKIEPNLQLKINSNNDLNIGISTQGIYDIMTPLAFVYLTNYANLFEAIRPSNLQIRNYQKYEVVKASLNQEKNYQLELEIAAFNWNNQIEQFFLINDIVLQPNKQTFSEVVYYLPNYNQWSDEENFWFSEWSANIPTNTIPQGIDPNLKIGSNFLIKILINNYIETIQKNFQKSLKLNALNWSDEQTFSHVINKLEKFFTYRILNGYLLGNSENNYLDGFYNLKIQAPKYDKEKKEFAFQIDLLNQNKESIINEENSKQNYIFANI